MQLWLQVAALAAIMLCLCPSTNAQGGFFPGIFGGNQQPVGMTGNGGMNIPTDGLSLLTGGAAGGTINLGPNGEVGTRQGFGPFGGAQQNWFNGNGRRRRHAMRRRFQQRK